MAFMSLNGIDVSYDKKKQILKGLNLEVEEGELVSLLGPSGCGKSTTLRVVAGFIDPQGGTFTLDGEDMTKVPVHKRQFGLVFQSYALFPHLSVYDNVAFGLRTRKMDKDLIDKKVREILEVCGLTELADRFPKQMSGGQRQRVALARALVIEPKLLLLDEPLSNLDAKLRLSMRVEIKRLQKRLGITTLFVTHDQEECFSISDKVAVMNGGVIEQFDTPENIYKRPATEFSRVDFPIPGSPPTSTREPRTTPLPSTRSSSANPVLVRSVSESSISSKLTGFACAPTRFPGAAISEAAAAYRPAAVPDDAGADGASTIVFHALHAGHCPIHLEDS